MVGIQGIEWLLHADVVDVEIQYGNCWIRMELLELDMDKMSLNIACGPFMKLCMQNSMMVHPDRHHKSLWQVSSLSQKLIVETKHSTRWCPSVVFVDAK